MRLNVYFVLALTPEPGYHYWSIVAAADADRAKTLAIKGDSASDLRVEKLGEVERDRDGLLSGAEAAPWWEMADAMVDGEAKA
jgi:hypothetical protein